MFFVRIRREPGSNTLAQNVFDSFWSEAEQRMYEYGVCNQQLAVQREGRVKQGPFANIFHSVEKSINIQQNCKAIWYYLSRISYSLR